MTALSLRSIGGSYHERIRGRSAISQMRWPQAEVAVIVETFPRATTKKRIATAMRFSAKLGAAVVALMTSAAGIASGEVSLPHLLSDHAVLQRQAPIHIWGNADPGETVTVKFHDQTRTATANDLGKWSLWLMPEKAGGPYTLTATGSTGGAGVTVSDLLVGDVWLASGQSNMEMPLSGFPNSAVLKNGPEEIAHATLPNVRLLRLEKTTSEFPLN